MAYSRCYADVAARGRARKMLKDAGYAKGGNVLKIGGPKDFQGMGRNDCGSSSGAVKGDKVAMFGKVRK